MEIKKKEYRELIKYKEDYYKQFELAQGLSLLCDYRTVELNNIRNQRDAALLNFETKICLVGKRGVGKTTFIKKTLPSIKNYLIHDINNEYEEVDNENKFFVTKKFNQSSFISQIKNNKDKTIIIEDASSIVSSNGKWIFDALKGYNYIFIYQQFNQIQNIVGNFDYIYDFDTNEDDVTKYDFRTRYENKIIQL